MSVGLRKHPRWRSRERAVSARWFSGTLPGLWAVLANDRTRNNRELRAGRSGERASAPPDDLRGAEQRRQVGDRDSHTRHRGGRARTSVLEAGGPAPLKEKALAESPKARDQGEPVPRNVISRLTGRGQPPRYARRRSGVAQGVATEAGRGLKRPRRRLTVT